MCTVVVRWMPDQPLLVLALRDERVGRPFDDPGAWWPDQPDVIGGRDRTAGGSWCVTDVPAGVTALVLNRPQRPVAAPGATSRGALPLLAVDHQHGWPAEIDLSGLASFALVLATPERLTLWAYDGAALAGKTLQPGTHMVTSGAAEDGKASRYLARLTAAETASDWRGLLVGHLPEDDPTSLVVRHQAAHGTFATVFAQVFESRRGSLSLTYSRTPWVDSSWVERA